MDWKQTIIEWRKLSAQERRQRHLRAIPRGVTNSMAMEQRSVSEQFIRDLLGHRIPALDTSIPPSAYRAMPNRCPAWPNAFASDIGHRRGMRPIIEMLHRRPLPAPGFSTRQKYFHGPRTVSGSKTVTLHNSSQANYTPQSNRAAAIR